MTRPGAAGENETRGLGAHDRIDVRAGAAPDVVERQNPWTDIFGERGRFFTEVHEDIERISTLLAGLHAKRVLDLGSGTGRHLVHLARLGFSVYGLDESPEATEPSAGYTPPTQAGAAADEPTPTS